MSRKTNYVRALGVSLVVLAGAALAVTAEQPTSQTPVARVSQEKKAIQVITSCNVYGQKTSARLLNADGKPVAERRYEYNERGFIGSGSLVDLSTGKVIDSWTYDTYSRRQGLEVSVCMDDNGDLVRKNKDGAPHLFGGISLIARQQSRTQVTYGRTNSVMEGSITTILSCENCRETTSGLCGYVW